MHFHSSPENSYEFVHTDLANYETSLTHLKF